MDGRSTKGRTGGRVTKGKQTAKLFTDWLKCSSARGIEVLETFQNVPEHSYVLETFQKVF